MNNVRFSLSANTVNIIINHLKSQPYEQVRPIFDILDSDLQRVEEKLDEDDHEEKVTSIKK